MSEHRNPTPDVSEDPVLLARRGPVAVLTLNRPHAINAFNQEVRHLLPLMLQRLDDDPGVRAVILHGAGERGFCVGADIKEFRAVESIVDTRRRMVQSGWIEALDRFSKPTIAAIHGFCLGGGLEIAMACDIRMAAQGAVFGLPEVDLGLIPGGGGTQRLPRLIGLGRALDLLLTGERIDAAEAYRIGLVSRLVSDPALLIAEAERVATTIAGKPPAAEAAVKEAARAGIDLDLAAGLRLEKDLFSLLLSTEDRLEAANAFREKRTPNFTGR